MAKKKKTEQPVQAEAIPAVKYANLAASQSSAQIFARQRRIQVLSDSEGEQLKALLEKAGFKLTIRTGVGYEMITTRQQERFVIESLTKSQSSIKT